jgi:hypothetical protein
MDDFYLPELLWSLGCTIYTIFIHNRLCQCRYSDDKSVSSVYIWSENPRPKSETRLLRVNRADKTIDRIAPSISGKECAKISYFDFDLKTNLMN